MYKALAFKELRESAWIGGLVFIGLLGVVLDQMGTFSYWGLPFVSINLDQPFHPHKIPFIHQELYYALAMIVPTGALVLGFRQVLGESLHGTWLFVLHRPAPRSALILTKVAVGLVLLLVAAALPVLIFALWAATAGHHASPFVWGMTAQAFRICFGATAIYLAACLSGLRPARWMGSRLLPLIPGVLAMFWVYITVWWPLTGWIAVFVLDALYIFAILETARSRDYP
jgi:ABC-type transport system involved in multi-copper enzyme maturation permease subunit